jgi:23S rRNA (cytidine1920-2'-O)/16S rRNA (cytidine1409-2'-O)-methyltransferase
MRIKKCALIEKLVSEGWFENEKEALPWIMTGKVLVNDKPVLSGKAKIPADGAIRVKEHYKRKYVNKGGLKLQGALACFNIDVSGKIALDCGASTGGFTDCLLQHGAGLVYAVDAGHNELAGKLLINENVVNMERTNISDAVLTTLRPKPDIITLDLSYLSLKTAVPACKGILGEGGDIIALVKPIVEVASPEIKRSGDINRRGVIAETLTGLCQFLAQNDFAILGMTHSPIRGNKNALEYFVHLRRGGEADNTISETYHDYINGVVDASFSLGKFDKNNAPLRFTEPASQ